LKQRWILIESLTRKADASLWEPELKKLEKRLNRDLKQLQQMVFACKPDALEALMRFQDTLAVHQVTQVRVEPLPVKRPPGSSAKAKNKDQATATGYRIKAKLERRPTAEASYQNQRARFILATNQLDAQQWPADKLLQEYKGQQKAERGFRFLKDPLFFASSLFVKKAQRVEALALVMALTLMVYTLAERKLRQTLATQQQTVLDQKKQPSAKPTFRWVIQKFQGIH
ncbi:MAG: IS1634 family transposase, partial [Cyanobacteria bacterium J06638_22]